MPHRWNPKSHPSEFSDRQLAGQRMMVGFDGTELNNDLKFLIDTLQVGGIILFSRNIDTPARLQKLCTAVQAYGRQTQIPPLFIAVDQEGGTVARLREPFTQFAGAAAMRDEQEAERFAHVTADELSGVGINMNMAPVLDIAPADIQSIMAERSFGADPDRVSKMGIRIIDHLQQERIMAVAKHFPGIGRTRLDSHIDLPRLDIGLATMKTSDLAPFRAAIAHNVAGIMLSHIFYENIDPAWPASLSPVIARKLLREDMDYAGLVVTDDLDMGAIKKHYNIQTVTRQILEADIDLALICHKGPDIEAAWQEIRKQMTDSQDMKRRAITSVERILKLKQRYIQRSMPSD
jgi:beta-N-acetylhexosaminidase